MTETICSPEGALRLAITFKAPMGIITRLIDIAEKHDPQALTEAICSEEGALRFSITFKAPESIKTRLIDIAEKQNPQALTETIHEPEEGILRLAKSYHTTPKILRRLETYPNMSLVS